MDSLLSSFFTICKFISFAILLDNFLKHQTIKITIYLYILSKHIDVFIATNASADAFISELKQCFLLWGMHLMGN